MPSVTVPYKDLSIVGYGPVPEPIGLPAIVTMIFRHRDNLLFAPYRLSAEGVEGAAVDTPGAFECAQRAGDAAALDTPIAPKPDHLLWLDLEGKPHYDPRDHVLEHIERVSEEVLVQAEQALERNDLDVALRLAENAVRVNEENVYALVLSAAAYRLQGNEVFVRQLAESAEDLLPGFPFLSHVVLVLKKHGPPSASPTSASATTSVNTSEYKYFRLATFKPTDKAA